METATKKRGRPRKHEIIETALPELEKRTAQNLYYAMLAIIQFAEGRTDSFFVTNKGNIRRQGIAEQIGRMYEDGTITEEQARELINTCKEDYKGGAAVKDIEANLRLLRQALKRGTTDSK